MVKAKDKVAADRTRCGKTESLVQKIFEKISKETARCSKCGKDMSRKSGSTTSLTRHAELFHPLDWKAVKERAFTQLTIPSTTKKGLPTKKCPLGSKERKFRNRQLVRYIAKDMKPLNSVNMAGFRAFCATLDPHYVLPSCKTLRTKLIPKIHSEVMAEIQKDLNEG